MLNRIELTAIDRYIVQSTLDWWNNQPAERKTAICDSCSYETIARYQGSLIGSYLWCDKCFDDKAIPLIMQEGAVKMLGRGMIAEAIKRYGNPSKLISNITHEKALELMLTSFELVDPENINPDPNLNFRVTIRLIGWELFNAGGNENILIVYRNFIKNHPKYEKHLKYLWDDIIDFNKIANKLAT